MISKTINDAIKVELGSELPGFKPLAFSTDVARNSYRQAQNVFGVRPGGIEQQTSGTMGSVTYKQKFEVVVVGIFGADVINDAASTEKSLELMGTVQQAYARLIRSKCGAPGVVMNVTDFSASEPEIDNTQKTITVRASLDVTYRITI